MTFAQALMLLLKGKKIQPENGVWGSDYLELINGKIWKIDEVWGQNCIFLGHSFPATRKRTWKEV